MNTGPIRYTMLGAPAPYLPPRGRGPRWMTGLALAVVLVVLALIAIGCCSGYLVGAR